MKPLLHYNEFINHKGMDLEILGETFAESLKRNDNHTYHSKVSIINCEFGEVAPKEDGSPHVFYFPNLDTEEGLKQAVRAVKNDENNLPK